MFIDTLYSTRPLWLLSSKYNCLYPRPPYGPLPHYQTFFPILPPPLCVVVSLTTNLGQFQHALLFSLHSVFCPLNWHALTMVCCCPQGSSKITSDATCIKQLTSQVWCCISVIQHSGSWVQVQSRLHRKGPVLKTKIELAKDKVDKGTYC